MLLVIDGMLFRTDVNIIAEQFNNQWNFLTNPHIKKTVLKFVLYRKKIQFFLLI